MSDSATADALSFGNRPVLVLSPHLDDAWLSTAALLMTRPCEVWTVFAGAPQPARTTGWDQRCGFPDSGATMRARTAEDRSAFDDTPHLVTRLPYLDAAYSGPAIRRRDMADLSRRLHVWLGANPRGAVALPVCAGVAMKPAVWDGLLGRLRHPTRHVEDSTEPGGGAPAATPPDGGSSGRLPNFVTNVARRAMHADYQRRRRAAQRRGMAVNPDHLAVRDAALDVCRDKTDVTLAFYEDLPYLWSERGHLQASALSSRLGTPLQETTTAVDRGEKFAHLKHYASQLVVLDPAQRRLSAAASLPPAETYWTSRRKVDE